jgi:lipopolysaccharide biosynthesis protein
VDSGFSYLEATKSAVKATSFKGFGNEFAKSKQFTEQCENTRRVVVIHAFYLEEFSQILEGLSTLRQDWPLVVTCPQDLCEHVQSLLRQQPCEFLIFSVPNKGRDVLPFLFLGKEYDFFGADWVLKLHTKKSPHREDGSAWLNSFLSALTQVAANPQHAAWKDNSMGLMAPAQHIVPLDYYWGSNAERVTLLMESNLNEQDFEKLIASSSYVAGSMFLMARPLLNKVVTLPVSPASFEEETGQIDGTTAHALERMFGVLAHAHSLTIFPIEIDQSDRAFQFAEPTGTDGAVKDRPA